MTHDDDLAHQPLPVAAGASGPVEVSAGPRTAVATDLALIGTFAALIAVGSLVAVAVSAVPVPITLQTFAVLLAGAVLGARRGALAVLLYLTVGLAGLPIFAQGFGGPAVLGRPSVGYLLAFPIAAWLVGWAAERGVGRSWPRRTAILVAGAVAGSLAVYAVGVPVLAARAGMSLGEALVFNGIFVPFDAVKLVLAVLVAASVHRAFPDLLPRRRPA